MDISLFNNYWDRFSDSIESMLIRKMNKTGLDINSVNYEVGSLTSRWKSNKYSEGAWLNELIQEDENKGNNLCKTISEFSFKKVQVSIPSMLKYYVIATIIGAVFSAIILSFIYWRHDPSFSPPVWKTILSPVLCFMLSFGFFVPQGKSKVDEAKKKAVGQYMEQVVELRKTIDHILFD